MTTIIQYLTQRLGELGINEVFGVPGDYNFNVIDAVEENPDTKWIGCCNELNAGYAADGYARIKGIGAIVTTFGVGALSAINAVAGSYSEGVPVISIVGMPKKKLLDEGKMLHHFLNSDYNVFERIYANVTAHTVVLSMQNAQEEIEEALSIAYNQKKPVYIGICADICAKPIKLSKQKFEEQKSDPKKLTEAVEHLSDILDQSKKTVIISEYPTLRLGLKKEMEEFIEKSGFLVTTMMMGKGSIDESSPTFIGTYAGNLISKETAKIVEQADCVLGFGVLMSDFNTGGFSAKLDLSKNINVQNDVVTIKGAVYENVLMKDVLRELTDDIMPSKADVHKIPSEYEYKGASDKDLTQNFIYSFMQNYLRSGDIYLAETGLASLGSMPIRLPKDVTFCTQTLWGSIGWATPACLGASIADREKRPILLTGEGSHQMTFQEIGTMLRYDVKPIIVVLSNSGYTIERLLSHDPMDKYNNIALWDHAQMVKGFSGKIKSYKARTEKEFATALDSARQIDELIYVEAFTKIMDAPSIAKRLAKNVGN